MNLFDDPPIPPQEQAPESGDNSPKQEREFSFQVPSGSAPICAAQPEPTATRTALDVPDDLQISWSWPHFLVFLAFAFVSFVAVNLFVLVVYAPRHRMTGEQLERYFLSKPQVVIGSMLLLYGLIFFFLYVTLTTLRGQSFWKSLGWRAIQPHIGQLLRNPLLYLLSGCGLSLFVAIVSSQMNTPKDLPMEELFKYRQTALLFMAMAVLVAPLVEETLFRGYIYPSLARFTCSILEFRGVKHATALRGGVAVSILLTGILFGSLHGYQLGWTPGLVGMLVFVGIVFTTVRAWTGSVLASYLMHLGYNSLISFFAILGTHGFTKLPPHH